MFGYYVRLAMLSPKRNPVLSLLTVSAIGIGIGVAMTTLTVYHMMSANPLTGQGDRVYAVQLDGWDKNQPYRDDIPEQAPWELTWRDTLALLESDIPARQAAMYKAVAVIEPPNQEIRPSLELLRVTGRDFFAMFDVPFLYGGPWDRSADDNAEQVIVLSRETNENMFGGEDSVGQQVRIDGRYYTVTGVLNTWAPTPKFYDVNNGAFDDPEDAYMPFSLTLPLELDSAGNTNCWKDELLDSFDQFMASECVWIQYWVQLDSAAQKDAYQSFLDNYTTEQKSLGRFERPLNNRLTSVPGWLDARQVVRDDNKVLVGLSFMFLIVCLFNAVGLVLAKFVGKAPQVGLRRALGASTGAIFRQHLVETALVGVVGGLLGLGLAQLGLLAVRNLYTDYDRLASLDLTMVGTAIVVAIVSGIVAGLYPTWRICRIAPAGYLKTQ